MSGLRQTWEQEFHGLTRERNLLQQEIQHKRIELSELDGRIATLERQRPASERDRQELRGS